MIIVDSRQCDPKSEMVVKHESANGNPISYKPIRKIEPNIASLSPLAQFIVAHETGSYIGGFLHRKNDVRVEAAPGTHPNAGDTMWGIPTDARNYIQGWLFDVFEPGDDETAYFNRTAEKILKTIGPGGRVIINGSVFDVTT